jgi:N-acetylmuramoyl-L-alanine amidase
MRVFRSAAAAGAILWTALTALGAQGTPAAAPLLFVSRDERSAVPTTMVGSQEWIALDEVAARFRVTVREDAPTRAIAVSYRGRTMLLSPDRALVSVEGRVVTLPAPPMRAGSRWFVPLELLPRALGLIYDRRIDLRRVSRLLIVGDLRVARVAARVEAAGPPTRASLEVTPAAEVTAASSGGRVIVRVDADVLDLALPASGAGLVESIRAGDQPDTVVIGLASAAADGRVTTSTAEGVTRVVIEVPLAAVAREAPPPPPTPAPRAGEATLPAGSTGRALGTVAIDPGHGGDDAGVRGPNGVEEKHLTLDVARRLRALLESRLGLRVVMTRDDDRTVSFDDRTAAANNGKADLMLSLHANASPTPAVSGAEVFVAKVEPDGRGSVPPRAVLPVVGGTARAIELVPWEAASARHVDDSAHLAAMLEAELRARVAVGPRPVQRTPLRVAAGATMPVALVELAYLTHPAQAAMAEADDFKNALAQALFEATARFAAHVEERRSR